MKELGIIRTQTLRSETRKIREIGDKEVTSRRKQRNVFILCATVAELVKKMGYGIVRKFHFLEKVHS